MTAPIRILVLGSGGMAGHLMTRYFQQLKGYNVLNAARRKVFADTLICDAGDSGAIETLLDEAKPDVVVNCVGALIADSAAHPDRAILMNSWLPRRLESLGTRQGWTLVHLSTDCVFSGSVGGYTESSFRDADNVYGRTKALGEIDNDLHLTLRTSIIGPEINPDGTGLLQWFLKQQGQVNGYARVYWSGVTTLELARAVDHCLKHHIRGLVHLCGGERIAKSDLLEIFNHVWRGGKININPLADPVSDKSLRNTRNDFKYAVPGYREMCESLKEWTTTHQTCYPHIAW